MMAMSAVARSDRSSPPLQAGVKCDTVPVGAVNASRASPASEPYLSAVMRFMNRGGGANPEVVEQPDHQNRRGGRPAHLLRPELDEVAQVLGEDRGDGAQGGGADDGELGPAEEEGGERAEPLEQVGEDPARPGQAPPPARRG